MHNLKHAFLEKPPVMMYSNCAGKHPTRFRKEDAPFTHSSSNRGSWHQAALQLQSQLYVRLSICMPDESRNSEDTDRFR